jgi:hypothetical protein
VVSMKSKNGLKIFRSPRCRKHRQLQLRLRMREHGYPDRRSLVARANKDYDLATHTTRWLGLSLCCCVVWTCAQHAQSTQGTSRQSVQHGPRGVLIPSTHLSCKIPVHKQSYSAYKKDSLLPGHRPTWTKSDGSTTVQAVACKRNHSHGYSVGLYNCAEESCFTVLPKRRSMENKAHRSNSRKWNSHKDKIFYS